MGSQVYNVVAGKDFAIGKHFVELHRRIILPSAIRNEVEALLDTKEFEKAGKVLKAAVPQKDLHAVIDVFLQGLGSAATATAEEE